MRGRVLVVTGDALDPAKSEFPTSTRSAVITEPFDLNDVRSAVRQRLAELAETAK